jgi:arginyl-tRNA synthetase
METRPSRARGEKARALLVSCARTVVGQCLEILGIESLEKM